LFNSSVSGPAWLSGGPVGPEGSLLCTALLVALWFVIGSLFQEVKFPGTGRAPELPAGALDSTSGQGIAEPKEEG
jgi:hypothetical protein